MLARAFVLTLVKFLEVTRDSGKMLIKYEKTLEGQLYSKILKEKNGS